MANRMRSALFITLILFVCALSMSTGMPMAPLSPGPPQRNHSTEGLTYEEREELYRQTPAVPDERLADAELDNAYQLFKLKPTRPTKSSNSFK